MPDFGGGSGSSPGFATVPTVGPPPAPPKQPGGGGFIDFGSLGSVLSAPVRATEAGLQAAGSAILGAGKGLIGTVPAAYHEIEQNLASRAGAFGQGVGEAFGGDPLGALRASLAVTSPVSPADQAAIQAAAQAPTFQAGLARFTQTAPITGGFLGSLAQTGQDVEQVARAAGNTLLPGQPFGSNVGQLGSGPGLLGNTGLAHAVAPGGGGILPRLLSDVANASILTGPVAGVLGSVASTAGEAASSAADVAAAAKTAADSATSAAEQGITDAAQRAQDAAQRVDETRQAAATGDPAAAAAHIQATQEANAAAESLREAQQYAEQVAAHHAPIVSAAQQAADEAQARATAAAGHAATAKLVHNLGQQAANSPFAAPGIIGRHVLSPALHALVGTDIGQRLLAPTLERVGNFASTLAQHVPEGLTAQGRAEKRLVRGRIETGQVAAANEGATLRRGFEGAAAPTNVTPEPRSFLGRLVHAPGGPVPDADAEALTTMRISREDAQLRQLMAPKTEAGAAMTPRQVEATFQMATARPDGTPQYTPEQIRLAMDVFGPGPKTPEIEALRARIEAGRAGYESAAAQQEANYARLRGETQPLRGAAGEGAFRQVEHNIAGEGPNIDQLKQWQAVVARYERLRGRFTKGAELAGRQLERATGRLEGLGLSPEELHNPRALLARVLGPANEVADAVVKGTNGLTRLAQDDIEPRIRRIAQRALDGKVPPQITARDLASEILKASQKDPGSLSAPVRGLVTQAAQRGMGVVPRGTPDFARSAKPVELLGAGRERLRAGTVEWDRAVTQIAKGQETFGEGVQRLAQPAKPPSARQLGAAGRLAAASSKLADLRDRVSKLEGKESAETPVSPQDVRDVTSTEARKVVVDTRQALKEWHAAQARDMLDELSRKDIVKVNPFPPDVTRRIFAKGAYRTITGPDWSNPAWIAGGGEALRNISKEDPGLYRDTRFIGRDGKNPEQIAHNVEAERGGTAGEVNQDAVEEWLHQVQAIRYHEAEARRSITSEKYNVPERDIVDNLRTFGGFDRETAERLAQHIAAGHPTRAAEAITDILTEHRRGEVAATGEEAQRAHFARTEPGGDVARALEADQQADIERGGAAGPRIGRAGLDEKGKTLYDQEVARAQAGVQGQIVAQRQAQQIATPSPARVQGQREGALIARGQTLENTGAQAAGRADVAQRQGQAIVGQAHELTQETAARVAGPIGQLYARTGAAERDVVTAAREYSMQLRALDRLDAGLAADRARFEASVEAAPRAWRPVLEVGQRINNILLPIADMLDRTVGAGAGDVYRVAAYDAIRPLEDLQRAGLDPRYFIGTHEGKVPASFEQAFRSGEAIPRMGKTGVREAGIGLAHPTTFREAYNLASRRLSQQVGNEVAQDVFDSVGQTLRDRLVAAGMPAERIDTMSSKELAAAMQAAHAHDFTEALGRRAGVLTPDTPVVPAHVWNSFSPYVRTAFADRAGAGATFLRAYDSLLRHWKAADLYLTGRFHTTLIFSHAVEAMVGGGIDPASYFRDVQIARRLERLRIGQGSADDEAFVAAHATPAQLEGLRNAGGFTPGAVVDRGYTQTQFGGGMLREGQSTNRLLHPIEGGWRFQAKLDNVNRTAVWLAQLDKGLDKAGLADFRTAYPDLAHLSDAEIKNQAAIMLSIRTLGDFVGGSPIEQELLKRIIPFYPWLSHITKLAANLAIHNPLRVAWLLHVGLMFGPQTSQVDWLQPAYDVGSNRWVTPPRWNPFDTLNELPFASHSQGAFAAISPLINYPFELGTGYNLQQGRQISRPYQQPAGTTLGVTGVGPLGEPGYLAESAVPGLKALREAIPALIGHQAIARYGTGQPVLAGPAHQEIAANDQQIPFTNTGLSGALGPLAPLIGLGSQQNVNADQIIAAAQKRNAAARKLLASYARERAAATVGP